MVARGRADRAPCFTERNSTSPSRRRPKRSPQNVVSCRKELVSIPMFSMFRASRDLSKEYASETGNVLV